MMWNVNYHEDVTAIRDLIIAKPNWPKIKWNKINKLGYHGNVIAYREDRYLLSKTNKYNIGLDMYTIFLYYSFFFDEKKKNTKTFTW